MLDQVADRAAPAAERAGMVRWAGPGRAPAAPRLGARALALGLALAGPALVGVPGAQAAVTHGEVGRQLLGPGRAGAPRVGDPAAAAATSTAALDPVARGPGPTAPAAPGLPTAVGAFVLILALGASLRVAPRGPVAPEPGGPAAAAPAGRPETLAAVPEAGRPTCEDADPAPSGPGAWPDAAERAGLVGVWERDAESGRARWSAGMRTILGPLPGIGRPSAEPPWLDRVHPEDRPRVAAAEGARLACGGASRFAEEFRLLTASGEERWVRSQGVVERDATGRPRRVLGAWVDITARRAWEAEQEAQARQRELLAGEIHHRVKNSLQLVLGLLLMQARRAAPEAAAPLREAALRISTIANVHRRLYEAAPGTAGDLRAYLADLAREVHASIGGDRGRGGPEGRPLRLALEPGIRVPPDRLPSIGIVAAELMTNAMKYGQGAVTLRLARTAEGGVEVAVEDDGRGFPEGFEPAHSRGLGMRVATTLARQLGGRIVIDRAAPGGRVVMQVVVEGVGGASLRAAPGPGPAHAAAGLAREGRSG